MGRMEVLPVEMTLPTRSSESPVSVRGCRDARTVRPGASSAESASSSVCGVRTPGPCVHAADARPGNRPKSSDSSKNRFIFIV